MQRKRKAGNNKDKRKNNTENEMIEFNPYINLQNKLENECI